MNLQKYRKEIIVTLCLALLFLAAGYYSQMYFDVLEAYLGAYDAYGMVIYVLGATVATIIAPLSFLPILPVAVTIWGSFLAAVLSILAWSLGAAVAFVLARWYGRPLVMRVVGKQKMESLSAFLPKRSLFIAVVLLRTALPVDLLSYALGLFSNMRFWPYMAATVIGITPFAFIFSYIADFNLWYQILVFGIGVIIILISFPYLKRRYMETFIEERQDK